MQGKFLSFGLFLITLVTLMMEITLTRVFDVILTPNMAYMVITLAMFSFGLSGVYVALKPTLLCRDARSFLSLLALLLGLFSLAILPVINWLPFNYFKIAETPLLQFFSFLGMYLALVAPFFLAGLIISTIFSTYAKEIQTLYFWDLTGAAVGCIIFVPFMPIIGPGGLLFCSAALALLASAVFSSQRIWSITVMVVGIVVISIPFYRSPDYFDFRDHLNKLASRLGQSEFTRWDPISKIDVTETTHDYYDVQNRSSSRRIKLINYDGGTQQTVIYPFDGNFQKMRDNIAENFQDNFWNLGVLASHYLKRDTKQKVMIIGSAGGQEVKAALMYGASHVDGVEMVGTVVDLGKRKYASYNGNIFNHPNVNVLVGEGRSVLRANDVRYDIIQIFSNHTSSSIAAGSGAVATNYLQTVEAYREYFDHLTDNGVLQINHHVYPRMVTIAGTAWKNMGRTEFHKHVLVFEKQHQRDLVPTFLVKMKPWTRQEVDELNHLFSLSKQEEYKLVEDPLHPENSFLSPSFYSGDFAVLAEIDKKVDFQMMPSTDNQPYFLFLRKINGPVESDPNKFMNLSTAYLMNSQFKKFIHMDTINLYVTGAASIFFTLIFVVLPLHFSGVGKTEWSHKGSCLAYFSCLGAGFIIFELVFIQIFMQFIGFPLYTYSAVIFTLLLGAGIGSLSSEKLGVSLSSRWMLPFIGILFYHLFLLVTYAHFFNFFIASPIAVRVFVSSILIFPMGFFMGMPFPLGILAIKTSPSGAIAWAWAMNAVFTVAGGLASVILSILLGFRSTLLFALLFYFIAFLAFTRIRKTDV
jgi:spermidine synthase